MSDKTSAQDLLKSIEKDAMAIEKIASETLMWERKFYYEINDFQKAASVAISESRRIIKYAQDMIKKGKKLKKIRD